MIRRLLAFGLVLAPFAAARAQELQGAFIFGSRNLEYDVGGDSENGPYTMVHHSGNDSATYDGLQYNMDRGWGFNAYIAGATQRNGSYRFGPFDDSPNGRNRFANTVPEEIFDSFIGFKNFRVTPDDSGDVLRCNLETDPSGVCSPPSGGSFRIDVPNGVYRFVVAVGDADNPHAHRVVVANGGTGNPAAIPTNHVVLIHNHDQAQYTGGPRPDRLGAGVFGVSGFDNHTVPDGDGADADPVFVNHDRNGMPTDGPADSPFLAVTAGYLNVYLLQGNSNPGPGGVNPAGDPPLGNSDPNGGDLVLFEVWKVGDIPPAPMGDFGGQVIFIVLALGLGAFLLLRRMI